MAACELGLHDIYLNVAGGLRITEPAADLAAAAALVSSLVRRRRSRPTRVYFGEIGLSGAIRPVAQAQARLKEAAKLGFASAVAPRRAASEGAGRPPVGRDCRSLHITDLVAGDRSATSGVQAQSGAAGRRVTGADAGSESRPSCRDGSAPAKLYNDLAI